MTFSCSHTVRHHWPRPPLARFRLRPTTVPLCRLYKCVFTLLEDASYALPLRGGALSEVQARWQPVDNKNEQGGASGFWNARSSPGLGRRPGLHAKPFRPVVLHRSVRHPQPSLCSLQSHKEATRPWEWDEGFEGVSQMSANLAVTILPPLNPVWPFHHFAAQ